MVNIVLWVFQGLVAFAMLAAGGMKLATPREKLIPKMPWATDFSATQIKLISAAEVLGGIGLIAPWATGILPVLTPVAALGLTVIMGGAVATHVRRKEPPVPAIVLAPLSLIIALGRLGVFG
jgi:hypothetical protein